MKKWPWQQTEKRESSYTDTLIRTIINEAGGTIANPTATAALEMAAGVISRAFMAAEVNPEITALSPHTLGFIGRELIRSGEVIFLIDVINGRPVLFPSSRTTITGGSDPDSWRYQCNLAGPSGMAARTVSAAQVIHIRYSYDPARPWKGIGPLQAASLAGRLSAETMEALGDEASGPRGSFLPFPEKDGQDDTVLLLRGDVKKARGALLFVESMANDFGSGNQRAPQDWSQRRFGADPPESMIKVNDMVTREIVSACGISPTLFDPKSSAAAREAWRQLLFGTVAPLGKIVEHELSQKLFPVQIAWQELRASDLQARARSVNSLVAAGVDTAKAMEIAGL